MKHGTITGLQATWGSGLAVLYIDNAPYYADNGPLVRALDDAYGDIIAPGHRVDADALIGKEIYFQTDELGVLTQFVPAAEYDGGENE